MKKLSLLLAITAMLALLLSACTGGSTSGAEDAAKLLCEVKTTQFFTDEEIPSGDIEKILSAGVNAPSAMNSQPWHFTAVTDDEVAAKLRDAMSSMKPPAGAPAQMPKDMPTPPEGAPKDMPTPPEGMPKPSEGKSEDMPAPPAGAPEGAPEGKPAFSRAAGKAGIGDAPLTIVISCAEGSELDAGLAVQNMSAEAQLLGYGTKIMTAPTMALNGENAGEYKELLSIPENQKVAAVLLVGKAATEDENPDAVASATTRNPFEETVTIID